LLAIILYYLVIRIKSFKAQTARLPWPTTALLFYDPFIWTMQQPKSLLVCNN
jgi:hypothetical protein